MIDRPERPLSRRDLLKAGITSLSAAALGAASATEALASPLDGLARVLTEADLVIYGATSAGVIAAVEARRLGKRVVLVEPGERLGGITASGLGATDFGNGRTVGGLSRAFYGRIREHYRETYGLTSAQHNQCHRGFKFEPRVAEEVFRKLIAEAGVTVHFGHRLKHAVKDGTRITALVSEKGRVFSGQVFLDATYEGDLMAAAGVSYTVGREPNARYKEKLNGVHFGHPKHNFRVPVDPYVVPGDPTSGLLKGISGDEPGRQGQGDRRVQAYCFRMCLTNFPSNRIPFPKPADYDPERYTLLARYIDAGIWDALLLSKFLPNGKADANNCGAFSLDNIGMSYDWPEGDASTRERIFREHVSYQQGLMWFLCHDPRVPEQIRSQVSCWGLPKDEFVATGGWPHQLYVREGRRMVSSYVMTEHNCWGKVVAEDSVGLGSYAMDSHNCQRVVRDGRVTNEGNVENGGFDPYPISYRSLVPKEKECSNLLIPVALSASHIAYGSIRMEPVFMVLAQSAAAAASLAIDRRCAVQQISIDRLQAQLREEGQVLSWPPAPPPASVVTRSQ